MLDHSSPAIDGDTCRRLYRDMVLARTVDTEAYNLQRQGELALWLSCSGQEAAQVGSIRALRDQDYVFPSYREHAAALCRGITPGELLAQWRGVAHGGWAPAQYRFHINSLVLGTQTLHAVGYALGVKADGDDDVVLAYLGDGSTSQGDVNEALNWAAVTDAPVIFFCQNNQWAISTPSTAQTKKPLHERAAGFGLETAVVDGNDVTAVYAVTCAAADRVRGGGGPVFIEAETFRMAGHSTSDDPTRYRDEADVAAWRTKDPIERMRTFLLSRGWLDDDFEESLNADLVATARCVRDSCTALTPRGLEAVFRHTLVDETELLRCEREQLVAFQESFQ
jgi:pyruvate dehydrogenase E1 component alpha subunit